MRFQTKLKLSSLLFFIAIFCLFMGIASTSRAEEIQKPYEIDNVLITFFWFDTLEELQSFVAVENDWTIETDLQGLSAYEPYVDKNFCHLDMYVVRPREVDDEYTLTIGHEVVHCVHGDYHEEVK